MPENDSVHIEGVDRFIISVEYLDRSQISLVHTNTKYRPTSEIYSAGIVSGYPISQQENRELFFYPDSWLLHIPLTGVRSFSISPDKVRVHPQVSVNP